ncbi:MAG: hypothetical protein N3A02_01825 [Rectinema sp.]|nr:hypothetical protein [Rectinema sp.]
MTDGHPYPLIGQRIIRGVLLMVATALSITCIVLVVLLILRVNARIARVVPGVDVASGSLVVNQASEHERLAFAQMYTTVAETWSHLTLDDVFPKLRTYTAPVLHSQLEEQYAALKNQYQNLTQYRTAIPIAAAIGGYAEGVYTIGVAFRLIEEVGEEDRKKISATTLKIALLSVVDDIRTSDNPHGMLVIEYTVGTADAWLSAGFPDFWSKPKKP